MRRVGFRQDEVKLSITPLIDVTFLLLIFFMCAMKFKSLDYKVQAWLPKKVGIRTEPVPKDERMRIRVALRRDAPEAPTSVLLFKENLGSSEDGFRRLDESVRRIMSRWSGEDLPPGNIDSGPDVPHQDVMRALDSLMLGGVQEVYFRGIRRPASSQLPD